MMAPEPIQPKVRGCGWESVQELRRHLIPDCRPTGSSTRSQPLGMAHCGYLNRNLFGLKFPSRTSQKTIGRVTEITDATLHDAAVWFEYFQMCRVRSTDYAPSGVFDTRCNTCGGDQCRKPEMLPTLCTHAAYEPRCEKPTYQS